MCQTQSLCIYHDGLSTHSGYNESVSWGSIPLTFGLLQITTKEKRNDHVNDADKEFECT